MTVSAFSHRHALAALVLLPFIPGAAMAQPGSSAQGTASATIFEPISVTRLGDLHFGAVAVSEAQSGTVVVDAEKGAARFAGGARSACSASGNCAPSAALFIVRGEKGRDFDVVLPAHVTAQSRNGGPALRVNDLATSSRNRSGQSHVGRLDTTGIDELRVGGTLEIPAGTEPGEYSARVDIVVSYG